MGFLSLPRSDTLPTRLSPRASRVGPRDGARRPPADQRGARPLAFVLFLETEALPAATSCLYAMPLSSGKQMERFEDTTVCCRSFGRNMKKHNTRAEALRMQDLEAFPPPHTHTHTHARTHAHTRASPSLFLVNRGIQKTFLW